MSVNLTPLSFAVRRSVLVGCGVCALTACHLAVPAHATEIPTAKRSECRLSHGIPNAWVSC